MNEQIKELMLEAGYAAPELAARAQVLAKLVVNKCMNISADQGAWDAFEAIIEYFEVE